MSTMSGAGTSQDLGSPLDRRRSRLRRPATAACNRCRRTKKRCDNARPSCRNCQRISAECLYDTSDANESRSQAARRRYDELLELNTVVGQSLDWLRSQSPRSASSVIQRLRDVEDPVQGLYQIASFERAQNVPTSMSHPGTLTAVAPFLTGPLDIELSTRHPFTYPPLMQDTSATWSSASSSSHLIKYPSFSSPSLQWQESNTTNSPIPPGFENMTIRFWTTVNISNELCVSLLKRYERIEHPIYGFFDFDLFIRDLISNEVQFCSSLLVNAVLFWASFTFAPSCPEAVDLTVQFLELARLLMRAEQNSDTALNVAAFSVLAVASICYGQDDFARECMVVAIRMAEQLNLLGERRKDMSHFTRLPSDALNMLKHVAWGCFNFSTVYAIHFRSVDSSTFPKQPPLFPRPDIGRTLDKGAAEDHVLDPQWNSFKYFCGFWVIAHEIITVYFAVPGPPQRHVPMAFAEAKFQKLLQWAKDLPAELSRSEGMTHNVVEMHICYHATIMDLFRPYADERQFVSSPAADVYRPRSIFLLSLSHLHALSRMYHLKYAEKDEERTISWIHGPLYLGMAILDYLQSTSRKGEFLKSMGLLGGLLSTHPVVASFAKSLFNKSVTVGAMSSGEAKRHYDTLAQSLPELPGNLPVTSGVVIDQHLAMDNRTAASSDYMSKDFDERNFFESLVVT